MENTASVIKWFKTIKNRHYYNFICFNIVEFYPSVSQDLLKKAIDFASKFDDITNDKDIIIHAKKAFLTYKQQPWQKKRHHNF